MQVLCRVANGKAISFNPYSSAFGGKKSYPVALYRFNPFNASSAALGVILQSLKKLFVGSHRASDNLYTTVIIKIILGDLR